MLVTSAFMINSKYVPICNRLQARRVNSGKITTFKGYSSLTPAYAGFFERKVLVLRLLKSKFNAENFIPVCIVLVNLYPFCRNSLLECKLQP